MGKEQAGYILAADIARDGVSAGPKLSGAADGVGAGAGEGAAHPLQLLPEGGQGPLGEPSFHQKGGIHAKCAHNGQQKPQCGAAFTAGELSRPGDLPDGLHTVAEGLPIDLCAQSPQTVGGGLDVPVGGAAADGGGLVGKGGADQEPVSLGFGGDDLHRSV